MRVSKPAPVFSLDRHTEDASIPGMVLLIRSQPRRNMHRFYAIDIAPTLFGEWSVWRECGRLGQPGTLRTQTFEREADAAAAQDRGISRKLQRGYVRGK
jgi:predicted DNA-binding WGR domain protein